MYVYGVCTFTINFGTRAAFSTKLGTRVTYNSEKYTVGIRHTYKPLGWNG